MNVTITDQYGRIISDEGINEIPNATVLLYDEFKIFFLPQNLECNVVVDAYDACIFNLTVFSPIETDEEMVKIIKFENIEISESAIATIQISSNEIFEKDIDNDEMAQQIGGRNLIQLKQQDEIPIQFNCKRYTMLG